MSPTSRLLAVVGTSHSPMLATEGLPIWRSRAASDREGLTELIDTAGHYWSYDDLAVACPRPVPQEDDWLVEHARARHAISQLCADLTKLRLDLVLIIGDDQLEMFDPTNLPAISLYCGREVALPPLERMPRQLREAFRDLGNDGSSREGDPDAAYAMARSLTDQGFDVTVTSEPGPGRAIGHAYGVVAGQLVPDLSIRLIPVFINTYYEPNQPTAERCYRFGAALRTAIEKLPGGRRVAVIASGGLSHFIVNEAFDLAILEAMRNRDHHYLMRLPSESLQSGTSEVRNWICAAGAVGELNHRWSEYVPALRTPAGTGTGLAFALWAEPEIV